MKAGIVMGGSGPLLILTSYDSFANPGFVEKLKSKGLRKFIAFEVPIESCQERYGMHYDIVLRDLYQTDDLRVLDYNGYSVLNNFSFQEMGAPSFYE